MVVIGELPMLSIGVMQERVATPSMCTVQAPHSAMPQPNLVPVMPSTSRSTHSSGVSPSTSTDLTAPLTLMSYDMNPSDVRQSAMVTECRPSTPSLEDATKTSFPRRRGWDEGGLLLASARGEPAANDVEHRREYQPERGDANHAGEHRGAERLAQFGARAGRPG